MLYSLCTSGDLVFLTVPLPLKDEKDNLVKQAYTELVDRLIRENLTLLHEKIFGTLACAPSLLAQRDQVFAEKNFTSPIVPTYVEGTPAQEAKLVGIHAIAVRSSSQYPLTPLWADGQVGGYLFQGEEAEYLHLSDVGRLKSPFPVCQEEEACATLQMAEQMLHEQSWSWRDVCRTWFYLDNILQWYEEFNRARIDSFLRAGVDPRDPDQIIPASTGIMGKNRRGNACTLDLLAMHPAANRPFHVQRLFNPRQNEAPEYGSAFSRGLAVTVSSCQYVFVSGTASIDEKGRCVHVGDVDRQIRRTLENVQALIHPTGAGLHDVVQSTVFIKHSAHLAPYYRIAPEYGINPDSSLCMVADVCRDDLLFEIDATAVVKSV